MLNVPMKMAEEAAEGTNAKPFLLTDLVDEVRCWHGKIWFCSARDFHNLGSCPYPILLYTSISSTRGGLGARARVRCGDARLRQNS